MPNRLTTVGRITVTGTSGSTSATIRQLDHVRQGDLFRQSDVLESQRNLYESNLFRLATIDVPVQFDSVKNVNIDVTEAPLHEARVGPGLNNVDFLQFQAHYTATTCSAARGGWTSMARSAICSHRRSQGRGIVPKHRNDLAAPDTNISPYLQPTYTASIDFKQPAFLQRPADAAGFGVFAHRNINPGVFIDRGFGGTGDVHASGRNPRAVSLNYRYEINRVAGERRLLLRQLRRL